MKLKALVTCCILCVSVPAFASEGRPDAAFLDQFTKQFLAGGSVKGLPVAPVREAKMRFIINKTWVIKNSRGEFEEKEERVCSSAVAVNVYDVGNEFPAGPVDELASCLTSLDSLSGLHTYSARIGVGGFIYLTKGLFGYDEGMAMLPWFSVTLDDKTTWVSNNLIDTPNRDLEEFTLLLDKQPMPFFNNQRLVATVTIRP